MTASGVLAALLLFGLLGMLGQGIRAVVGLKNAGSLKSNTASEQSVFSAAYLLFSLMLGFIAGMLAGIALKAQNLTQIDPDSWRELLGIIASGYVGADFIENTMNIVIPRAAAPAGAAAVGAPAGAAAAASGALPAVSPTDLANLRAQLSITAAQVDQIHSSLLLARPSGPSAVQIADWNTNIGLALTYRDAIAQASQTYGMTPSLICAIAWRESGWGQSRLMRPKGPGGTGDWAPRQGRMPPDGLGWGRGLMQIDYASHIAFCSNPSEWQDPTKNILYGCDIFYGYRKQIQADISGISSLDLLRASVAAYNAGAGAAIKAIRNGNDVSKITYSPGYVDDIIAAMNWFQTQGFDSQAIA
jgi:soluble lytic murein transglycosylase-like protein